MLILSADSSSLIDNNTLAKYQSHNFPTITFKENNNGNIYIINGHHRIAAWKAVHQEHLDQFKSYEQLLKGGIAVANDNHDTQDIVDACTKVDELREILLEEGGWGAVILDYGMFDSNIQQFGE
jgi:hypothetical protein